MDGEEVGDWLVGGRDAEQGRGGEMKKLALPSTPSHERERGNDSNDREDGSLARRATRREWDVWYRWRWEGVDETT